MQAIQLESVNRPDSDRLCQNPQLDFYDPWSFDLDFGWFDVDFNWFDFDIIW